jgi:hypothetical protein
MKRVFKIILIALLIIFVIIQFFRPQKNISTDLSTNDITSGLIIPHDVQKILKHSCYDCHSNNTRYPWYFNIQPVAWWLDDHIKEGKRELNFSEFKNYKINRQYKKLEEMIEEVETEEMPLYNYTLIHRSADLSEKQKTLIINWSKSVMKQLKITYPPDSFVKK